MQRNNSFVMFFLAIMLLSYSVGSASAADPDVCSRGLGEPPFLSLGVDSNLLLLLDNSGSMLDMAYINATTVAGKETQCFDNTFKTYNPTDTNPSIYAGNYNRLIPPVAPSAVATETAWYKWVDGLDPWTPGTVYGEGAMVYSNGVVYRAVTGGTSSTGSNIYSDTGVVWENLLQPNWRKDTYYRAGAFVVSPSTLYVYFTASGTPGTVIPPENDTITWKRVWSWAAGTDYVANTYVLWKNNIYQSTSTGKSVGNAPVDDTGVNWVEVDPLAWRSGIFYKGDDTLGPKKGDIVTYRGMIYRAIISQTADGLSLFEDNPSNANWTRIDEGYYEMIDSAAANTVCTTAGAYSSSDLCIVKTSIPERVTAFVATGNMLNWLMSSKFDIEKTILTGGKFASDSKRLISENRGCSGSRFVKEVIVTSGTTSYKLTMAVRGPRNEGDPKRNDRVDSSDDTTRIEVLGISTTGYDAQACQDAIAYILSNGLNGSQGDIDSCLGAISGSVEQKSRDALNHALQTCWQNPDPLEPWKHLQTNVQDCQDLYSSITAADIPSYSQAYNCFGYYDPNTLHSDRFGYVGRCWGGGCNPAKISNPAGCATYPCVFTHIETIGSVPRLLRNSIDNKDNVTTDICTTWTGTGMDCPKIQGKDWQAYYTSGTGSLCDPKDATYATGWSPEIDPNDTTPPDYVDPSVTDQNKITLGSGEKLSDQGYVCVSEAMKDFCADSTAPQVIDASDQAISTTGTYGNLPAQLIDSGVLNQLGVDVPLMVMKGYALQITQPVGILQKNAENLRIGAMAFNKVGAWTECPPQTITTNDKIERYCPTGNKDGAQVISPIRLGTLLDDKGTAATADDRLHVDKVAEAINLVRATSWTPLAEAMYNAIGYYTQNTALRLNPGDFQTDSDVGLIVDWLPGITRAAGSYVIYTSVAGTFVYQANTETTSNSTTPDKDPNWSKVGNFKGPWIIGTSYSRKDIVKSSSNKYYITASTGTSNIKPDAAAAGKSGPHFDQGVLWEPLVDPVVYSCQENHILAITEGSSTADINNAIPTFIKTKAIVDPSIDTQGQCTDGLLGSTYLDDLTYFAWGGGSGGTEFVIYPPGNVTLPSSDAPFDEQPKNNLTTHLVVAGALRNSGTGECNPATLMQNAAANGGTEKVVLGESPEKLEKQLIEIFNELRQRASAGSAASVISSARGGEGAIYQAIFWPELVRQGQDAARTEYKVAWAGDVHGLFLDENGHMFEDTNHDRAMKPTEDLDNDGHFDGGECTADATTKIVSCADGNNDGKISKTEDLNGNGVFDKTSDPATTEDLDGDGSFDNVHEDVNNNKTWENTGDKRVTIYFDKDKQKSRACYNTSFLQSLGVSCTNAVDLEQVKFLWSANDWLSDYPVDSTGAHSLDTLVTESNRSAHISTQRKRYIFTWNDLDNDGTVDYSDNEVKELVQSSTDWNSLANDFDVAYGFEVNKIISWLRGKDWLVDEDPNGNGIVDTDEPGDTVSGDGPLRRPLRSRQSVLASDGTRTFTWRLGDIIHSTPQTVAAPAEGYHLLYNDRSYANFVATYKKRRHVVYFGANDGMLHAVNAGFYSDIDKKFCLKEPQADGTCPTDDGTGVSAKYLEGAPDLGAELWAYVPYNLQPHLKCLLSPLYSHKYFVDLKPRVFDAQIFKPDTDHPFGWGTILVGGLRFGGAPISAAEINPSDTVNGRQFRQFISSYFILDITNPEKKPVLLGELTQDLASGKNLVDLGYSTVIPTMVIAKSRPTGDTDTTDKTIDTNKWYLVFGSGPHGPNGLKGMSDQGAKVSVLPLGGVIKSTTPLNGILDSDGLVGIDNLPRKPMRIPKDPPTSTSPTTATTGTFPLPILPPNTEKAFVSDPITIDFDINPSNNGQYVADAVYFGTVEGEFANYPEGVPHWKGGGHLYRMVMNGDGHVIKKDDSSTPDFWKIRPLLDLSSKADGTSTVLNNPIQPITAAPSVGTDGKNYWIYFGTGRFFDPDDKTDREQQSYYGIKEPMDSTGKLTWAEVELKGIGSAIPGGKGLLKVDEILAPESTSGSALLACRNNATGGLSASKDCLPGTTIDTFDELEIYIAGTGACKDDTLGNNCVDGWYRDFYPYKNRERNIGQATLLGGLVTFTTYQPFTDVCRAEGVSYLYGVYYKTGTSWYENVFGEYGLEYDNKYVKNKLDLGRGLTSTPNLYVGSGEDDEVKAFIQTSTGEIKEIKQENLPVKTYKTGVDRWKEFQRP